MEKNMAVPHYTRDDFAEALWNKALAYATYLQDMAPHFVAEKALAIASGPGTIEERRKLVRAHNVAYTGCIIGAITIGLRAKVPSACTVIASAAFQEKNPRIILRKTLTYANLGVEFQAAKDPEILEHFKEFHRRQRRLWLHRHREDLSDEG